MKLILTVCFLSFSFYLKINAQAPVLVKDIRPSFKDGDPGFLYSFKNHLYFSATDSIHGYELWKSDGTATGTFMMKDINPFNQSPSSNSSYPYSFKEFNNELYFYADDGVHGGEMWVTDGSISGTRLFLDIAPGPQGSFPQLMAEMNGFLFFEAYTPSSGKELWKTDGTVSGTSMVKDIYQGTGDGLDLARPIYLVHNGFLYFEAETFTNGEELWKTDGTANGTTQVKDINPGPTHSFLVELTSFDSLLLFVVDDGVHGYELWKTDGTTQGTSLFKDIHPTPNFSSYPKYLTRLDSIILFSAEDSIHGAELWKTDGTANGTTMIKDINPISPSLGSSHPERLTVFGNKVIFAAGDNVHGNELWESDGTTTGTKLIKDISPGNQGALWFFYGFQESNGVIYFQADDGNTGLEVWRTDGTSSGTYLTGDIHQGSAWSFPREFTDVNGTLFFVAEDTLYGKELYRVGPTLVHLPEYDISSPITLFPNPVINSLRLNTGSLKVEEIEVINYNGKVVKRYAGTTQLIHVEDLSKGIYFLRVKTRDEIYFNKFIKQ